MFGIIGLYSFFNEFFQVTGISIFIFKTTLELPEFIVSIAEFVFIVIMMCIIVEFAPIVLVVFLLVIHMDISNGTHSLWVSILINIWPSISVIFYCLFNKTFSLHSSSDKKDKLEG